MLKLGFHIGQCCGIKTIFGLFCSPDQLVWEKLKSRPKNNADKMGDDVSSKDWFFTDEASGQDTYLERFDTYLDFCKKHRPSGVIEVVLAVGRYFDQVEKWEPLLFERGFRLVTSAYNSNSKNTIYIYHLVTREGKAIHYFKNGKEKKGKS